MRCQYLIGEICTTEKGEVLGLHEGVVAVEEEVFDLCTKESDK